MAILTQSAYARYRRCSKMAVSHAVKRGQIRLNAEGKVDTDTADRAWPMDGEPDIEAIVDIDGKMSFDEATRRKVAAQALLAELELKTREGLLIDSDSVVKAWLASSAIICAQLDNIATRAAPLVIGLTSVVEVEAIIQREVNAVRSQIAKTPPEVK